MGNFKENLYNLIGKNIKNRRTDKKISQSDFAKELNVSRSTISNIEVGRHQIPIHLLYRVSEILNTDISDFLPKNSDIFQLNSDYDIEIYIDKNTSEEEIEYIRKQINNI